ncbi:protein kinase [Lyngbya sp. PCC 8106]|uniref:protein kinase domain-containing protein n=1 Tax=Lyngbya sp. (strain PCC 8106) TaxID=313612 RepID=UPI0000EAC723|nr:protein kinase [Lyngbya sp. PCC 8106]EAW38666.1 serine/threonine kinase [Lyngbya sp. PCC 8106]
MSHCFNPNCTRPHNSSDAQFCQNCGSVLVLKPQDETTLSSRYRGIQLIGEGGFGRTFLAVDESQVSQPRCAIKQFFPQGMNGKKAAELFQQEAKQLKYLGEHPQIPQWLGDLEQDGYQYLLQEFIEGKNLAQELFENGAYSEEKIRQLLKDLLPILEFIHSHKIIHRDIKPENIIRRRLTSETNGNLVLVDFGAAKLITGGIRPKTGTMIGSAAYTAPEQLMGKAVFASDIYSLGVSCIHLLTDISPFDLFDSQEGNWVWRDYLKNPVSDELGHILDKMLQGATSRRYHSAAAVLQYLNPRPTYIDAFPGLKIPDEMASNILETADENLTYGRRYSEPQPRTRSEYRTQYQGKIVQAKLQEVLNYYQVQVQVSSVKKNQLTVVINRPQNTVVHYADLAKIIGYQLTQLQLKNIRQVKLLGRLNKNNIPEWKKLLILNRKTQLKNQFIKLKTHPRYLQFSQVTSQKFWLDKIHQKEFWIDVLMGSMITFIFSVNVIIFTPLMAFVIAFGFLKVKGIVSQSGQIAINNLFGTIATLFIVFGLLDLKIGSQGLFGIILAGLCVAMPMFYSKGNY